MMPVLIGLDESSLARPRFRGPLVPYPGATSLKSPAPHEIVSNPAVSSARQRTEIRFPGVATAASAAGQRTRPAGHETADLAESN